MKSQLAEVELHPYTTRRLAEERRAELLRDAEAWRLARPVQIQATNRTRWWILLLPWRRAPVRPACASVLALTRVDRPLCESTNAPDINNRIKLGAPR